MGTFTSWKNPEVRSSLRPLWAGAEVFLLWFFILFSMYIFSQYVTRGCSEDLVFSAEETQNLPKLESTTSKTGPFHLLPGGEPKEHRAKGPGTHLFLVLAHGGRSAASRTPSSSADSACSRGLYVGVVRALFLSLGISGHPCPPGPPTDSSFSSLKVPMGQIQKRGFCDLIFSIAEGSVVQKSSRLSQPIQLKETPCFTRAHAHTHTVPVETQKKLKGAT